ncbi:MAG: ribosome small subunit-dependent GTPase A [Lachnospiraceae bacterium]|nr:ribosome small subunit-dependent GTPase A [Lachnospiraceae bacterium]
MQGRIIKGIAGFYYVHVPDQGILECKAKGILRKNKLKPLVGDFVELTALEEAGKGNILQVLERRNELIRPAVANIDQALVIFSVTKPEPNFNLLDRFLIMMEQKGLECILVFNKCDIADGDLLKKIERIYAPCGYEVIFVSAISGMGISSLEERLQGKVSAVSGPSGVGKSSIINRLQNKVSMETGEISEKIQRGKHTTRHSELILINEESFILDTPGFSSLSVFDCEKEELEYYYPEFALYREQCKFSPCSHTHEPECGIKTALQEGKISEVRYQNYLQIYQEMKDKRKY